MGKLDFADGWIQTVLFWLPTYKSYSYSQTQALFVIEDVVLVIEVRSFGGHNIHILPLQKNLGLPSDIGEQDDEKKEGKEDSRPRRKRIKVRIDPHLELLAELILL